MSTPRDIELGRQERQWGSALQAGQAEKCMSAEDLLRFVEGALPAEVRGGVLLHLGHCEGCREVVLQLRATERVMGRRRGSWLVNLLAPTGGRSPWTPFAMGAAFALGAMAIAGVVVVTSVRFHSQTPKPGAELVAINDGQPESSHRFASPTPGGPPPSTPEPHPAGSKSLPSSRGQSGVLVPRVNPAPTGNPRPNRNEPSIEPAGGRSAPPGPAAHPTHSGPTPSAPASQNTKESAPSEGGAKPIAPAPPSQPADGLAISHEYCLVGAHHAYTLESPEQSQSERMDIETQYADKVADAEQTYKQEVDAQADADDAQKELTEHVEAAAAERDQKLAAICGNDDSLLAAHPDLRLEFEGPYQLVRIDYRRRGGAKVIQACQVLPAWPGYDQYVPEPYGWTYHRKFAYEDFVRARRDWITRVGSPERHSFWGLVGHEGLIPVTIVRADGHGYGLYGSRYGAPRYGSTSHYGSTPGFSSSRPRYGSVPGRTYAGADYGSRRSGTSATYGQPKAPVRRYGAGAVDAGSGRDTGYGGSAYGGSGGAGSYGTRHPSGEPSVRPGESSSGYGSIGERGAPSGYGHGPPPIRRSDGAGYGSRSRYPTGSAGYGDRPAAGGYGAGRPSGSGGFSSGRGAGGASGRRGGH